MNILLDIRNEFYKIIANNEISESEIYEPLQLKSSYIFLQMDKK